MVLLSVSGCQSVCPHWLQSLPPVLDTFYVGQDLQVVPVPSGAHCRQQVDGGLQQPVEPMTAPWQGPTRQGRHSASTGHHAPPLLFQASGEREIFSGRGWVLGQNSKSANCLRIAWQDCMGFYGQIKMKNTVQLLMSKASFPLLFLWLLCTSLRILFLYCKYSQNIAGCDAVIQQPSIIPDLCINFINQPPLLMSWPFVQWQIGECFRIPVCCCVSVSYCLQLVGQCCTFF